MNDPDFPWLVYNQDRSIDAMVFPSERLIELMGDSEKIYVEIPDENPDAPEHDDKEGTPFFGNKIEDQDW